SETKAPAKRHVKTGMDDQPSMNPRPMMPLPKPGLARTSKAPKTRKGGNAKARNTMLPPTAAARKMGMSRRREPSQDQGFSVKHSASVEARAATRCDATDAAAAKIKSRKTPTAVIGAGAEPSKGGDLKAIAGRTDPSSHVPINDTGTSQIALRTAYRM